MPSFWRLANQQAAAIVLLAAAATTSPAQIADWSILSVAPTATTQLEQSLALVKDGSTVHAFSAFARQWTTLLASSPSPTTTVLNEHAIVRDGSVFYGYSPRTASFSAQLTFSPTAALLAAGSPQTWHSVVIDGNYAHVYLAFTGQWSTHVFQNPPTVTMGRFCVLFADGPAVYGLSSYYGSLVPLFASGATATGAYGNVGIATSAGMVHGFSASRNTWASMPVSGTPTVSNGNAQPGFVAIRDATAISFFSGNTGTFTTLPAAPTATAHLQRYVAIVVDGTAVYGYSSLKGAATSISMSASPIVTAQQCFALLDDGSAVTAFSASTGTFAGSFPTTGLQFQTTAQVALASLTGSLQPIAVYSSYLNQWISAPAVTAQAYLTAVSAILVEPAGGMHGLSMHSPNWIYQPSPVIDAAVAGTSPPALAETFYARAGNTLYSFNPRTQAWRTTTTASPANLIRAHHATILAVDATTAYGFSIWSDHWESVPLGASFTSGNGQVLSAYVFAGSQILAYSGVGQLSMVGEFPHFYRAATQGSLFRIDLAGEAGAPALVAVSTAAAYIPSPPYGVLLIDPLAMIILAQPTMPANRLFNFTLQVPVAPGLSGFEFHFQAAVAGPSGVYLTNALSATVY